MKDQTILGSLDAELMEEVVSRRGAVARGGKMAGLAALASMPVMFGLMAKRADAPYRPGRWRAPRAPCPLPLAPCIATVTGKDLR